jgi:hypothetical protein
VPVYRTIIIAKQIFADIFEKVKMTNVIQGKGVTRKRGHKEKGSQGKGVTRKRGHKEKGSQGKGVSTLIGFVSAFSRLDALPRLPSRGGLRIGPGRMPSPSGQ